MSTVEDIRNDLAAMRNYLDQMKTEIKTEISQLNRRMDVLTEMMEQGRQQQQQNPVDGGGEGQVNQDRVDEAINNAGDVVMDGQENEDDHQNVLSEVVEQQLQHQVEGEGGQPSEDRVYGAANNAGDGAQDGQENDNDQQDSVSVKSEIESVSCQSDCDYWMNGEEDIEVKDEAVAGDSGTGGQQQPEDEASIEPVAGPSGISRAAQKCPQANPPRRSNRLANSQRQNLVESSDTSESDEDEIDSPSSPPNKKARTTPSKGSYRQRCPHCSKMVANLTEHRRIHTGERPYVCQHANCGQAFAVRCNLTDHIRRRHLGEKRHHCEQCGKRFVASSELVQHRRHVHSHERPYRCPRTGCDYAAPTKGKLDLHLKTKKHQRQ